MTDPDLLIPLQQAITAGIPDQGEAQPCHSHLKVLLYLPFRSQAQVRPPQKSLLLCCLYPPSQAQVLLVKAAVALPRAQVAHPAVKLPLPPQVQALVPPHLAAQYQHPLRCMKWRDPLGPF